MPAPATIAGPQWAFIPPQTQPPNGGPPTTPAPAQACSSCACGSPVLGNQQGAGALATPSGCLTSGTYTAICPPGAFVAYYMQSPLYVVKTPTRRDFDVPCAVAASFFSEVATKCASANSVITSLTLGNPSTGCDSTQVQSNTAGTVGDIEISAPPGCDYFTPGLLITIGFSQNVAPGPVSIDITATGSDGCEVDIEDIRVGLCALGAGQIAVLFNCVEEQRLYPVIGRLRTNVVQIPNGTTIPGLGALTADLFYPDETVNVHVEGPLGMTITVETLTWNMPSLSCIWQTWADAMNKMGV